MSASWRWMLAMVGLGWASCRVLAAPVPAESVGLHGSEPIAATAASTAEAAGTNAMPRPRLRWADLAKRPEAWFRSAAALDVLENVLSHQTLEGGWPKNTDTFGARYLGDPRALRGTFDNGATVGECRFLGRLLKLTTSPRSRTALLRAIDLILEAQYPNGGWPQAHPPGPGYSRHITFNDGTMVNLLELLRDVAHSPEFTSVDATRRERAGQAVDRGITCVLRCQVRRGDRLTVWCAQHDAVNLEPRPARAYEHPSLSGAESAGIVRFLMSIERPGPDVIRAVNSACEWFENSRILGLRQIRRDGDKIMVPDPSAPPLWARFYELESHRPIFSGRDGVIRYTLGEIEAERRNGYAWYGDWGAAVLEAWAGWNGAVQR